MGRKYLFKKRKISNAQIEVTRTIYGSQQTQKKKHLVPYWIKNQSRYTPWRRLGRDEV
jgi:hypothetical protein